MSIDPTDEDDSGDEQRSAGCATPTPGRKSPAADGDADISVDGVIIIDQPSGEGDSIVSFKTHSPVGQIIIPRRSFGVKCFTHWVANRFHVEN